MRGGWPSRDPLDDDVEGLEDAVKQPGGLEPQQ
jgi:hypothetical protein